MKIINGKLDFFKASEITYKPQKYYFKGGGASSPSTTTTVQKSDPWSGQQGYLTDVFNKAQSQFNDTGPSYYPDSTVVPFSPETEAALAMQTNRAISGSPLQTSANKQIADTLNGNYLYGGDGFNAAYNAASNKIIPQVNSMFANSGRTGSGLAQTAMTQALGDSFANLYGNERENQMRAAVVAPQMANQDYADISKLADVGAQREELSSENLQDLINRYNYDQNLPNAKLQQYSNLVQGSYGGTTTGQATSPLYRGSSTAGLLGGSMGGASLGTTIGGPGWGTVAGALGGGLLGLFS